MMEATKALAENFNGVVYWVVVGFIAGIIAGAVIFG